MEKATYAQAHSITVSPLICSELDLNLEDSLALVSVSCLIDLGIMSVIIHPSSRSVQLGICFYLEGNSIFVLDKRNHFLSE